MARAYRLLLLADHKWRDLPGVTWLKLILECTFGHRVRVVPFQGAEGEALAFRPDLVVFNNLYGTTSAALARRLRASGMTIAVLPNEGWAPYDGLIDYFAGAFTDLSAASLHFVWSERIAQRMRARGVLPASAVQVIGLPRFDFYREPLRTLFETREQLCGRFDLDVRRPIITVATNFATAKFARSNADFLVEDWNKLGLSRLSHFSDPAAWALMEVRARAALLTALREVVSHRRDLSFVIKPHPAEDLELYRQFVREAGQNVRVMFGDYIWNLLSGSDVHLSRGCTTGVEAWLFGTPTVETHLTSDDVWFFEDLAAGGDTATDATSLERAIERGLRDGVTPSQQAARDAYIERHFHAVDGKRTLECARALDACARQHAGRVSFTYRRGDARPLAARFVRRALRIPPDRAMREWRRWYTRTDAIGQWDKTIRPADLRAWEARLLPFVTGASPSPIVPEQVPTEERSSR